MTDAEKLAILIESKTLATRAISTGVSMLLDRDDLALLAKYESLGEIDDQLRHAAHLLRSDVAVLEALIELCNAVKASLSEHKEVEREHE